MLSGRRNRKITSGAVTGCSAKGAFAITKTGKGGSEAFLIGGFTGDFYGGKAEGCFTEMPVTLEVTSNAVVDMGGFAGRINANISHCYTNSNINITGSNIIRAGGFNARTVTGVTITNCYAGGNVDVTSTSTGNFEVIAGGFTGRLYMDVQDSYATGNVTVNMPNSGSGGDISAGGFAGLGNVTIRTTSRCFATGTVTVNSNGTGTTHVGGLFGNADVSTITYSAALGASVTATGGAARNIGRIWGSTSAGTKNNNHARNTMGLFSDPNYAPRNPTPVPDAQIVSSLTGKDGLDANTFTTAAFWTGLGFTTANWDFSGISSWRPYPILRGVGGVGLLGGQ